MNEDTTYSRFEEVDVSDDSMMTTFTQIVSCAVGGECINMRQQSLRARLEREQEEREQRHENIFSSSFRNLFKGF